MDSVIELHEERPIGLSLPDQVTLEVVETEPTVKGQTASSSYKPAIANNGVRIMIPPYMGVGEKIVVDTTTGEVTATYADGVKMVMRQKDRFEDRFIPSCALPP